MCASVRARMHSCTVTPVTGDAETPSEALQPLNACFAVFTMHSAAAGRRYSLLVWFSTNTDVMEDAKLRSIMPPHVLSRAAEAVCAATLAELRAGVRFARSQARVWLDGRACACACVRATPTDVHAEELFGAGPQAATDFEVRVCVCACMCLCACVVLGHA